MNINAYIFELYFAWILFEQSWLSELTSASRPEVGEPPRLFTFAIGVMIVNAITYYNRHGILSPNLENHLTQLIQLQMDFDNKTIRQLSHIS